jgi:hypothetical protein
VSFAIHVSPARGPAPLHVTAGDGEVPFPSADWRDFPVIVLTWWLNDYAAMHEQGSPVRSSFMNGPYEVEISPLTDGKSLRLRFLRRTRDGVVEAAPAASVSTQDYASALVDAAMTTASETSRDERDVPALLEAIAAHAELH